MGGCRGNLLTRRFYQQMLARGVLLHPRHMWFVSLAHTDHDIDYTLTAAVAALRLAADARDQAASAKLPRLGARRGRHLP